MPDSEINRTLMRFFFYSSEKRQKIIKLAENSLNI
nr:MAG TPA: hypothetical protein [Bacteriophage sp.]